MKSLLLGIAFVAIVASLGSALFFMMRRPDGERNSEEQRLQDDRRRARGMFWSLALRVGLSVFVFVCILLAWELGYLHPSGLPIRP